MLATALGDLYGSAYIGTRTDVLEMPCLNESSRFTGDTICMLAVIDHLLHRTNLEAALKHWVGVYPDAGYERSVLAWAQGKIPHPVSSWGNGALTRIAPVVLLANDLESALATTRQVLDATHSTQSIPVAQVAAAQYVRLLWQAREGTSREELLGTWAALGGKLHTVADNRVQGSPVRPRADETLVDALSCIAESDSFESLMANCAYHGGDTNTLMAVAGPLGEFLWGVNPQHIDILRAFGDTRVMAMLEALYEVVLNEE